MPKLIVFDVDGTLVDFEGQCRPRTIEILERIRRARVPIAIATGRPLALAEHTLRTIGGAEWAVCGNGASLLEVATGALHRDACLPPELVEPVIEGLRSLLPGVGFAVETTAGVVEEEGFVDRVPPSPHDPPVEDALAVVLESGAGVRKIIPFHQDYDHRLAELAAITEGLIDERCEVQYGMLPIVEVATAGEHKAVALQTLIDHLGIGVTDVVAFGDGGNDIEMLQWAGTGVAMGSGRPEVQEAADAVTASVEHGGVAVYLEPLLDAVGL